MPFQNFNYCIVCEGLRPELGQKLTILGFFGVAPNVEIVVANPNIPLSLSLLSGFPPVPGILTPPYNATLTVARPDGSVAFQSPELPLQVLAGRGGILGMGVVVPPPYLGGLHSIRISVNNQINLATTFNLRFPNPGELQGIGIRVPPGQVH